MEILEDGTRPVVSFDFVLKATALRKRMKSSPVRNSWTNCRG